MMKRPNSWLIGAICALGLTFSVGPVAVHADDPDDVTPPSISPTLPVPLPAPASTIPALQTGPISGASSPEASLQTLSTQLKGLAAQCYPKALAVTVQALPDDGSAIHSVTVGILTGPGQTINAT